MADQEIGDLATAGTITGVELVHIVQSGNSRQAPLQNVIDPLAEPLGKMRDINTQTDNYTLALTDAGKTVEMNSGTAKAVTIPAFATIAIPVDSYVNIVRYGAGALTVVGATGVTINGVSAGTVTIGARYGGVLLYKRGTNEWVAENATAV